MSLQVGPRPDGFFAHAAHTTRSRVVKQNFAGVAMAPNARTALFDFAQVAQLAPGQGIEIEWAFAEIYAPVAAGAVLTVDHVQFTLAGDDTLLLPLHAEVLNGATVGANALIVPVRIPRGVITYGDVIDLQNKAGENPPTGNVFLELGASVNNSTAGALNLAFAYACAWHLIVGIGGGD